MDQNVILDKIKESEIKQFINIILPTISQEEMANFILQLVKQADKECKQSAKEDSIREKEKQVYLKLQEDAFDNNLEYELSHFLSCNLKTRMFELDYEFRNEYDI